MADASSGVTTRDELERIGASQRAPHALYVTGEDQLRLTVLNALAGVTVTIRGRFEDLTGRVVPFGSALTPATDRTQSQVTVRLGDGWLLNAHVQVSAGAPLTGQTFAILSVVRGEGTAAIELATLAAGPITAIQRVSFPGSSVANSLEGAGAIRVITGATPAVGADISETVPTGARWELIALTAQLTASAAAANRIPVFLFDDGATVFFRFGALVAQTANQVFRRHFIQGGLSIANDAANNAQLALPIGVRLLSGYRMRTTTTAIDAGDQWTAPIFMVREWIEGS